jgi:hypothetical protein
MNKATGIVILHRARIIDGFGRFIQEPTYCGFSEKKYIWRKGEIESILNGRKFSRLNWEGDYSTFVIW